MDVPSQRRHDTHCLLLNVFSYWGVSEHVKSPQTDIFIGPQIFWCFPPTFSEKPMHITASWSVISHAIPMKSHEIPINPIISKSWRMFHDHPLVTRKTNGGKKNKQQPIKYRCLTWISWYLIVFAGSKKKHSSWLNPHFYTPNFCSSRSSLRRTWREGSWWWNLPPRGPRMDE